MAYDQNDFYTSERMKEQHGEYESLSSYTAKTFLWMFVGLLATTIVAVGFAFSGLMYRMVYSMPALPLILLGAELLVVLVLVKKVQSLSVSVARGLFVLYAVLNGVMFSSYFIAYSLWSILFILGMTTLYFGALALYGYFTKTDLSRIRPLLVGGLILLLVFGVLSFFLNLTAFDTAISVIGIAVFLGFTAYDVQKIKMLHAAYAGNPEMAKKASVFAALQLYLDFINLFVYLMRILGRRRS